MIRIKPATQRAAPLLGLALTGRLILYKRKIKDIPKLLSATLLSSKR